MRLDDELTIRDDLTGEGDLLPEARKALLVYHRDGLDVFGLDPDTSVVVGRTEPAAIRPRSRRMSRQHARFELRDDVVHVLDLDSTNGTWVNGERIREEVALGEDDEVTIGSVSITVQTLGAVQGRLHGLLAHERFVGVVDRALGEARTAREPMALLMVRALGPRTRLPRWVPRVRDLLRLSDQTGLYGPDTLEILLPGGDPERTERLALEIVSGRGPDEPVLVCGIASYPEDGSAGEALLEVAHTALNEARPDRPVAGGQRVSLATHDPEGPVVRDEQMRALFRSIDRVARSAITVLVRGETGTGKEVVARALHDRSDRAGRPLRAINCGAIPATLLESVLFGHERGAFTGADRQRRGVFEEAQGGTVFLDEIGELSPSAQVALLRVLETRRIQRVGSTDEIEVDVRVVCATHRDLEQMCHEGGFRWDLYYRLNSITLVIPPLRDRPADIRPLVERFVHEANRLNDRAVRHILPDALARLERYPWPGNVRELRNAVERAVVIGVGEAITVDDLPDRVRAFRVAGALEDLGETPEPTEYIIAGVSLEPTVLDLKARLAELERQLLASALRATDGNQTEAADLLRIPRRTLVYKIRAFELHAVDRSAGPLEPAFDDAGAPLDFKGRVDRLEEQLIREALHRANGDRAEAARLLGVQKRTLDQKCERLDRR